HHETCLRKLAVEHKEDPNKFMTITEKDKLDSISFKDRIKIDTRMCGHTKEGGEDPEEYMDMKVHERLIE
ncbi:10322_t:CDS:1, partial [Diversispora eburnea]